MSDYVFWTGDELSQQVNMAVDWHAGYLVDGDEAPASVAAAVVVAQPVDHRGDDSVVAATSRHPGTEYCDRITRRPGEGWEHG